MSRRHKIVLLLRELTDMLEGDLQYLAYRLDELFKKECEEMEKTSVLVHQVDDRNPDRRGSSGAARNDG